MSNDYSTAVGTCCPHCGTVFTAGEPHTCRDSATALGGSGKAAAGAGAVADSTDLVGVVLGERYQIVKPLGKGGMGIVYQARHTLLNSLLAVKILLYAQDEEAKTRFLREARIASQIQHPNTVFISDFGLLPDGRPYLVMEFLQGPTLRDLLDRGAIDTLRTCLIGAQIARGLQTVHDKGIVHRGRFNIKPPSRNANSDAALEKLWKSCEGPLIRVSAMSSAERKSARTGINRRRPGHKQGLPDSSGANLRLHEPAEAG